MLFSHDGIHDSQTHLASPSYFYDQLRRELSLAARTHKPVALVKILFDNPETDQVRAHDILHFSYELTRSENRTRELAEQLALLRLRVTELQQSIDAAADGEDVDEGAGAVSPLVLRRVGAGVKRGRDGGDGEEDAHSVCHRRADLHQVGLQGDSGEARGDDFAAGYFLETCDQFGVDVIRPGVEPQGGSGAFATTGKGGGGEGGGGGGEEMAAFHDGIGIGKP